MHILCQALLKKGNNEKHPCSIHITTLKSLQLTPTMQHIYFCDNISDIEDMRPFFYSKRRYLINLAGDALMLQHQAWI